jgi:hypothetical protein
MHKTSAGEKRKAMKGMAKELARNATAAKKAAKILPGASQNAHELKGQADKLMAEAESLKNQARLEDLTVWMMKKTKTAKKGKTTYGYWMASWREGKRVRNMHLGSCKNLDEEAALKKARAVKAAAFGIEI